MNYLRKYISLLFENNNNSPLIPTGEKTWSDGTIYKMDLSQDLFVHFTPESRAKQILSNNTLLMKPPYEKFGIDAISAISLVWGWFVPQVQTTHIKSNENIVAIVFQTNTTPKVGNPEEVIWNQDVILINPRIINQNEAISKLQNTPYKIEEDDQVVY